MSAPAKTPTVHLLHGFLGAGKTTFARQLERQLPAVRYTPDEWMSRLFGDDPPAEHFHRHLDAVFDLLTAHWPMVIHCGVDVVLDYGFWSLRHPRRRPPPSCRPRLQHPPLRAPLLRADRPPPLPRTQRPARGQPAHHRPHLRYTRDPLRTPRPRRTPHSHRHRMTLLVGWGSNPPDPEPTRITPLHVPARSWRARSIPFATKSYRQSPRTNPTRTAVRAIVSREEA